MKYAVVVFPGSNCDHDAYYAVKYSNKSEVEFIWHKDTSIPNNIDCIILPGGFSYGDYLRSGAIARFSPIMNEVVKFANNGGYVIGICNGFQILTEVGLLPGTLMRNINLNFICKDIFIKVCNNDLVFSKSLSKNEILKIPIAHGDGNYFADTEQIKELVDNNRIVFKYCNELGETKSCYNPNGSIENIAGITNFNGNVLGMMPHPERYSDCILGCDDGLKIFDSIKNNL